MNEYGASSRKVLKSGGDFQKFYFLAQNGSRSEQKMAKM